MTVRPHRPGPGILRDGTAPVLAMLAVAILAAGLRFWRLGAWGLEGDEVFTLRDSLSPQLDNPRPLLYFLNHLVGSLVPLDELGLRLIPAVCGVLAVPALFLMGRPMVGARAALLGSLLLAVNPLHVYHSQYARYWSLVVLLSAIFPFAVYLGLRDRRPGLLAFGAIAALLAVLAHPVSLFLVAGLGVWLLTQLRREHVRRVWNRKGVRVMLALLLLAAALVAARYVPILRVWVSAHDEKSRLPDHLLALPGGLGVKQIGLLLAYMEGLTIPLVLAGALGIYLLWPGRQRALATLLICLFIVPVACVTLLSLRTAVSVTYMLSTAPVFFLGAGVLLDRLAGAESELRPRWLLSASLVAIIIAAGAPTLISQYRDGRRQDFRGAARWLDRHLTPGDVLFSDQFRTVSHYLPGHQVEHLSADPAPLIRSLDELRESGGEGALWIVMPYSAPGGHRTNPRIGPFREWIHGNCQLREALGVARLDFRQNQLQIYRCPPAVPAGLSTDRVLTAP